MTKKRQEAVQTERTLVEQTAIEQPKANVKYKDTIFRMLFSEPEHLLSLYNAVTGKDYRDPDALNVVTLENAVYMGMKNDLAFVLDEYYGAAEPPVRCGESHLSGLTEPLRSL